MRPGWLRLIRELVAVEGLLIRKDFKADRVFKGMAGRFGNGFGRWVIRRGLGLAVALWSGLVASPLGVRGLELLDALDFGKAKTTAIALPVDVGWLAAERSDRAGIRKPAKALDGRSLARESRRGGRQSA